MDKRITEFLKGIKGSQKSDAKYYKREWRNNRWKYWYTKEEYDKENPSKTSSATKTESIWKKIGSFFGLKSDKEIVAKVKSDYSASKQEIESQVGEPVSFDQFKSHLEEYFKNKEQWDKKLLAPTPKPKPEETKSQPETEPSETPSEGTEEPKTPKEKIRAKAQEFSSKPKWNMKLMKFISGKYSQKIAENAVRRIKEDAVGKSNRDQLSKDLIEYSKAVEYMPKELIDEMDNWDVVRKSPYSDSFYNTEEKSWEYTPDGSLRIANHWNFYSQGDFLHCRTDKVPPSNSWTIAKYNAQKGLYEIIKSISYEEEQKGRFEKKIQESKLAREEDRKKTLNNKNKVLIKAETDLGTKDFAILKSNGINIFKMKKENYVPFADGTWGYIIVKFSDINRVQDYSFYQLKVVSKEDYLGVGIDRGDEAITEGNERKNKENRREQIREILKKIGVKVTASPSDKLAALSKQGIKIWNGNRAYFNASDFIDVDYEWKKGKLRGATVDGQDLSATKAMALKDSIFNAKIYYDSALDDVVVDNLGSMDYYVNTDVIKKIAKNKIKIAIEKYKPEKEQKIQEPVSGDKESSVLEEFEKIQEDQKKQYFESVIKKDKTQIQLINQLGRKYKLELPEITNANNDFQKQEINELRNKVYDKVAKNQAIIDIHNIIKDKNESTEETEKTINKIAENIKIVKEALESIQDVNFFYKNKNIIEKLASKSDRIESPNSISVELADLAQKIKEHNKKKIFEDTPVKKDFSDGLAGKYKDNIKVEQAEYTSGELSGQKFFRLFSPYDPEIVSKVKEIKESVYKQDYKTRKQYGTVDFMNNDRGKYWRIPEHYKDQLQDLLKDYLS